MLTRDVIEEMYEGQKSLPLGPIRSGVFDKRVLLPITSLPHHVQTETGQLLDSARIPDIVAAGWFSILSSEMTCQPAGYPMYIPGRIGLFLDLEARGVSSAELAAYAQDEERLIDHVLVNEEMPYEHDDDIAMVIVAMRDDLLDTEMRRDRLVKAEAGSAPSWLRLQDSLATPEGLRAEIERLTGEAECLTRSLTTLERCQARGGLEKLAPTAQEEIRREAFVVRTIHETTRISMVQTDRAQIANGFSHFINFSAVRCTGFEYGDHTFSDLNWEQTLASPWVADGDTEAALPIRLPGVVLRGTALAFTRWTTPADYQRLIDEYDLETYFRLIAAQDGQRLCVRCLAEIPAEASSRQRYCTERCRNAAKAETYRTRHPNWKKADRHGLPRDLFGPE